jgi:hypothetical protein
MVCNVKLQTAATACIANLVCSKDTGKIYKIHDCKLVPRSGYEERQIKMREIGVYKMLQQLSNTTDQELYEK